MVTSSRFDLMLMPRDQERRPLHFVWASDAGVLGKDTLEEIGLELEEQIAYGLVSIQPGPATIPFDAPLTNSEQMVAFLYNRYHLPEELALLYPASKPLPVENEDVVA